MDDPNNVWKAVRYARPAGGAMDVPDLVAGG